MGTGGRPPNFFWPVTRDTAIALIALSLTAYEVLFGGARPSVLTFLSGLLLSPIVLRIDRHNRDHNGDDEPPRHKAAPALGLL